MWALRHAVGQPSNTSLAAFCSCSWAVLPVLHFTSVGTCLLSPKAKDIILYHAESNHLQHRPPLSSLLTDFTSLGLLEWWHDWLDVISFMSLLICALLPCINLLHLSKPWLTSIGHGKSCALLGATTSSRAALMGWSHAAGKHSLPGTLSLVVHSYAHLCFFPKSLPWCHQDN